MWDMGAIKELAINRVFREDTVDPVTKVIVARDYGLTEELLPSLSLYTRQGLVKAEDEEALGLKYFLKILEIQERVVDSPSRTNNRGRDSRSFRPTLVDLHDRQKHDFTFCLRSIFQGEIERLDRLNTDIRSGPQNTPNPAAPVLLEGLEMDARFFPISVFFLVS
jgi:hypothetical protein